MIFIYCLEFVFFLGVSAVAGMVSDLRPLPFWVLILVFFFYLIARYYEERNEAVHLSPYVTAVFALPIVILSWMVVSLRPTASHSLSACLVLGLFIFIRYLSHMHLRNRRNYSLKHRAWLMERGYVFYGDENWSEERDHDFFEKHAEEFEAFKNRPEFKVPLLTFIEKIDGNWLGLVLSLVFLMGLTLAISRAASPEVPAHLVLFFVAMGIYSAVNLWPSLYVWFFCGNFLPLWGARLKVDRFHVSFWRGRYKVVLPIECVQSIICSTEKGAERHHSSFRTKVQVFKGFRGLEIGLSVFREGLCFWR